ncbi:MAG TPA: hypothetical protein VGE29_04825 [Prosthecobacter sp.]
MNTFALLATPDPLQVPEPEPNGGLDVLKRRHTRQESPNLLLMAGADGGALQALSETVGIRMACRSVVRWYHGGINE